VSANITGNGNTSFSEPVFEALRQRKDVCADLVAYAPLSIAKVAVRYGDWPEEAEGEEVSGNFLSGLTAQIIRGRGFTVDDEKQHASVAVHLRICRFRYNVFVRFCVVLSQMFRVTH